VKERLFLYQAEAAENWQEKARQSRQARPPQKTNKFPEKNRYIVYINIKSTGGAMRRKLRDLVTNNVVKFLDSSVAWFFA
jgi:hypothetical protein